MLFLKNTLFFLYYIGKNILYVVGLGKLHSIYFKTHLIPSCAGGSFHRVCQPVRGRLR